MLPCVWPVAGFRRTPMLMARTSPNVTMPRSERLRINRPNPCRRDNAACGTWYSSIVGCSPTESRSRIAFDRQRSATSVHSHRRGGVSRRPVRTTGQHRLVLSRCERDDLGRSPARRAGVDVGHDDRVDALALLASRHISVPVLFDNDAAIYAAVFDGGIMVIPATALVTPNGIEKDDGYEPQSDRAFVASWKRRIASHVK